MATPIGDFAVCLITNNINIKLSTVITNSNDDLLYYLLKMQKLGVKKINMTFWRTKLSYTEHNLENLKNQYRKVYEKLFLDIINNDYKLLIFLSEDKITEPLRFLLQRDKLIHRCDWNRQLIIDSKGNLWSCLYFIKYPKYKIGNIHLYKKSKIKFIEKKDITSKECKHCYAKYLCGGFCKYTALMKNGNINIKDEFECSLRRFFAEETIKLLINLFNKNYNIKNLYYEFIDKI